MSETSPHPWGKRAFENLSGWLQGNIPTPVGKTQLSPVAGTPKRKHPHARGEDLKVKANSFVEPETSPRPWGRLSTQPAHKEKTGNIPTPVGKTISPAVVVNCGRKHPHARGEDEFEGKTYESLEETSPRPWGRQIKTGFSEPSAGNIPTPVGKTAIYQLFSNGNNYILWPFQFQIFKDSSKKLLFLLLSGIGRFFLEN